MNVPFRQAAPLRGEKPRILRLFSARSADFSRMLGGWRLRTVSFGGETPTDFGVRQPANETRRLSRALS
jgi:hypothetical protein